MYKVSAYTMVTVRTSHSNEHVHTRMVPFEQLTLIRGDDVNFNFSLKSEDWASPLPPPPPPPPPARMARIKKGFLTVYRWLALGPYGEH